LNIHNIRLHKFCSWISSKWCWGQM